MGATAVLVGFRHKNERKQVLRQTDECLVADVRAGDDTAFEAIYDRYARGVLAFCVHMLGSREAAEDALQLTFVSAYRALRTGNRNISLRPWLYTIARNRCLSELRARRDADDVDVMAVDRPLPDGLADQVQRREELREMVEDMQRLPADQRAALVLFELGDHSHNEIAAVLGVRSEKVKALIFQAREGLLRGRHARNRPCEEIRERLATLDEKVLPRSTTRAHIDRCPSCASFEDEVRRQRAALALILPVIPAGELKGSVLGAALGGGGAAAVGGSGAVGAGVGGGGAIVAGGTTTASGAGAGAIAVGGGATGTLAGGGAGAGAAVAASAPVSAIATGLTAVGADYVVGGIGGLGASGVVAKILTAAAIATGAAGAGHPSIPGPRSASPSASVLEVQLPSTSAATPAVPILATAKRATPASTANSDSTATGAAPVATPSSASPATATETIAAAGTGSLSSAPSTAANTSSSTGGSSVNGQPSAMGEPSRSTLINTTTSTGGAPSPGSSPTTNSINPPSTNAVTEPGPGSATPTDSGAAIATDANAATPAAPAPTAAAAPGDGGAPTASISA